MEWKERLNVELSQTGKKYRLIIVKIHEWLRFAFVGLFRRWKTRALRSACEMEWKERVNVELPQTGE